MRKGERAVKRLIIAVALLATVAAPALAQRKPYSVMSDEEKADDKAKHSTYRAGFAPDPIQHPKSGG